jgi:3-keto-5-aminohexanoate cleavage enzyme
VSPSAIKIPLIIEVRGNEFAATSDNPHVPVGADAIIADALDCAAAGAAGYHWHARGVDGVDRPDDIDLHRAVVRGIRPTGLVLHPTLGFTSTQGDVASRLRTVLALNADPETRIDIVPADIGAFILDGYDTNTGRFTSEDQVLLNTTGHVIALLDALHREQVRVLAVVWSPGAVRSALHFRREGILPAPTFWQLGFTGDSTPGGPPPTAAMAAAFLEQLPDGEPWTVHVRDGRCLDIAEWAIRHGGHVSIGLGDDPYRDLGLPTNADLVRLVAEMAGAQGRAVASPLEARQLLRFA